MVKYVMSLVDPAKELRLTVVNQGRIQAWKRAGTGLDLIHVDGERNLSAIYPFIQVSTGKDPSVVMRETYVDEN